MHSRLSMAEAAQVHVASSSRAPSGLDLVAPHVDAPRAVDEHVHVGHAVLTEHHDRPVHVGLVDVDRGGKDKLVRRRGRTGGREQLAPVAVRLVRDRVRAGQAVGALGLHGRSHRLLAALVAAEADALAPGHTGASGAHLPQLRANVPRVQAHAELPSVLGLQGCPALRSWEASVEPRGVQHVHFLGGIRRQARAVVLGARATQMRHWLSRASANTQWVSAFSPSAIASSVKWLGQASHGQARPLLRVAAQDVDGVDARQAFALGPYLHAHHVRVLVRLGFELTELLVGGPRLDAALHPKVVKVLHAFPALGLLLLHAAGGLLPDEVQPREEPLLVGSLLGVLPPGLLG